MCKICVEFQLGKLSTNEALQNMRELQTNDPHKRVVEELIEKAESDKASKSSAEALGSSGSSSGKSKN